MASLVCYTKSLDFVSNEETLISFKKERGKSHSFFGWITLGRVWLKR